MFIYSIYDRKAQYFLPVFQLKADGEAIRAFTNMVVSSDTDVSRYPGDFDLVKLASFDQHSGALVSHQYEPLLNGLVALTTSNQERSRYKKALEGQLDIEDFTSPEHS